MKSLKKAILILLLSPMLVKSQSVSLTCDGNYYGKNLYVINPGSAEQGYCVTEVLVNNVSTNDEINSNAFEIDLSRFNFLEEAKVSVEIKHKTSCLPKIINPEALKNQSPILFISQKYDAKNSQLIFNFKGDAAGKPFTIEQFKWNKWISVGELEVTDSLKKIGQFTWFPIPHSGQNIFRVSWVNLQNETIYSRELKFISKMPELFIVPGKFVDEIKFTGQTNYEIYDEKGIFVTNGFGISADIKTLPKGKFWINYDNKNEQIIKK